MKAWVYGYKTYIYTDAPDINILCGISLYQEINYMLTQQYIFPIVWRYTYSIRLFLIEAKHKRYKYKQKTLIYKVQKVYS